MAHGTDLTCTSAPRYLLRRPPRGPGRSLWEMSIESDAAELSSLRAQLDEVARRLEAVALRYQETPDSAVAIELFEAERALRSAGRVVERAQGTLGELQ